MRKIFLLIFCIIYSFCGSVQAATRRFSIECGPAFSINKIYAQVQQPAGMALRSDGLGLGVQFGASYYLLLQESVYFSAGLAYGLGGIALLRKEAGFLVDIKESHRLQSFRIPLICRLYTNEIKLDTSLYGKVGLIPAIYFWPRTTCLEIGEAPYLAMRRFGCLTQLGVGVKYDIGLQNSILVGFSYCMDMSGAMYREDIDGNKVNAHDHCFCIDMALLL